MADIFNKTTNAKQWARVTMAMKFLSEEKFNVARRNRILWYGLMRNN